MKFYCPDWDDRVDPGYDFATERFSLVRDPYADDLYGHEVMPDRIYDGLLISRMALSEVGPKRQLADRYGLRAYLRLPADFELFGDPGAFGYIRDREPPYETAELVAYYQRLGFDAGVSADHAIVREFWDDRHRRYQLTLRNAADFLRHHTTARARFAPVGAIQGWDEASYADAAEALVAMGYTRIAIGGLARSRTTEIERIVRAVRARVPDQVDIHVFGVARRAVIPLFIELGIASVDSSAPLRQAWLSATDNYLTPDTAYTALRIPIAIQERPKQETLIGRSDSALMDLRACERAALATVRSYDRRESSLKSTLTALVDYDRLMAPRLDGQKLKRRAELYRRTLRDRPWRRCPCLICQSLGIEVILFRGNNRNRRRGFHNLWITYRELQRHRHGNAPV